MNQASNLQHLLEKFSPLRGMSFENKYINKKRPGPVEGTRAPEPVRPEQRRPLGASAARREDQRDGSRDYAAERRVPPAPAEEESSADEGRSEPQYQQDEGGADNRSGQHSIQEDAEESSGSAYVDGRGPCGPEPLQEPPKASRLDGLHLNDRFASHNYSRMIDMFEQKGCLDLGRSSNFDSQSNTNRPSKRADSYALREEDRAFHRTEAGHGQRDHEEEYVASREKVEGEDWININTQHRYEQEGEGRARGDVAHHTLHDASDRGQQQIPREQLAWA